jgi:hypothetical protein
MVELEAAMKRATAGLLIEQIEKLSYMVDRLDHSVKAAEKIFQLRDPEGFLLYQADVKSFDAFHPNRAFVSKMEEILEMISADSQKKTQRKAAGR